MCESLLAPGRERGIGDHVVAASHASGAHGGPGGAPAALGIGPGEIERVEIRPVEAGVGCGPYGFGAVLIGKTDPHHGVSAIVNNDAAYLVEEVFFGGCRCHGKAAVALCLECAVEFVKFFFLPLALDGIPHGTNDESSVALAFYQVVLDAHADRLDAGLFVIDAGKHDNRHGGEDVPHAMDGFEAAAVGEGKVEKHGMRLMGIDPFERGPERPRQGEPDMIVVDRLDAFLQQQGVGLAVLHEKDAQNFAAVHAFPGRVATISQKFVIDSITWMKCVKSTGFTI